MSSTNDCIEVELPYDLIKYLGSEDCDVRQMCRICFSVKKEALCSFYQKKDGIKLSEMFTSLTCIQIQEDDGLPSNLCQECQAQVANCYRFKRKCLKSDHTLRSILKGEFSSDTWDPHIKSKQENEDKNDVIKTECQIKFEEEEYLDEEVSDIQYLEDIDETASENGAGIVQSSAKDEKYDLRYVVTESLDATKDMINEDNNKVFKKPKRKLKSHVCDFCSKKYTNMQALKAHIKRVHNSSKHPNACKNCKESFESIDDLRLHTVLHEAGPIWQCLVCMKEFSGRPMFRRHIQRHMQVKRYACASCGKPFTELYALRRHSRVHTGEQVEKPHACTQCDKRYVNMTQLNNHMLSHTGARPCVCPECGKGFPSQRLLSSHQLTHSDVKPYQCRYCEKRFRHESTRNTHHRTHTGEKPYTCTVCGKSFIQNSNLTLHMRVHTGEKPYTCERCGRKFSSGSTLKMHVRSHTGERPYACDVCGKQFARKELRAHSRTHTGERAHACEVCGRRFARLALLRDHSRIHTGEKPFECKQCTQKFPTRARLVKHAKVHETKKKKTKPRIVKNIVAIPFSEGINLKLDKTQEITVSNQDLLINDVSNDSNKEVIVENEVNLENEELILPDDSELRSDLLVIDDNQAAYQDTLCLSSDGVIVENKDNLSYGNNMNLVTVNEGEVSISSSSAIMEGATVKLYQVDQSLVQMQIQSVGGQVTISKITRKMTTNF